MVCMGCFIGYENVGWCCLYGDVVLGLFIFDDCCVFF